MSGMTRRALLRGAAESALVAAGLAAFSGCRTTPSPLPEDQRLAWRNWAGDYACRPKWRVAPKSEDELASMLGRARGIVRPVGAGHSFSPVVPTADTLIASDRLNGVIRADATSLEAEVFAGTRLHALGAALAGVGQALPNQPDIDDQVLGGAIATSTHGTGAGFGSLSAYVEGLTLATPSGELVECDRERESELFAAARCSVGALGVVTRFKLQNTAPRHLEETTIVAPIDELLAEADGLRDAHTHMEFMALPYARLGLLVTTDETTDSTVELAEDPASVEQLRAAWQAVGGDPGIYQQVVLEALGTEPAKRRGPSHLVLAHARYARFREMEYTVPAEVGPECLQRILERIESERLPVVFPIEYRYVKSDDIWLSMFHERDGCTISLHQYADEEAWPIFERLEPIFWEYEGRPHWGKLHSLEGDRLASLYPRYEDFVRLRRELDPTNKMLNPHLESILG